jgi:hypothetical protein
MPPASIDSTMPPNSGTDRDIQAPDCPMDAMASRDILRMISCLSDSTTCIKVAFAGAVCVSLIAAVVSSPNASSSTLAACTLLASAGVFCAAAALGRPKKTHGRRGVDTWFTYLCLAFAYGGSVCVIAGTQGQACAIIAACMGVFVAGIYALQMYGSVGVREMLGGDIEGGTGRSRNDTRSW